MHQSLQGATFYIEHILPQSAGGTNDLDNLALACPSCNLAKSNRLRVVDPETQETVPLFNPREQRWSEHFAWDQDWQVIGLTPTGRATILALVLNHSRRLLIREAEEWFNLFPPTNSDTFSNHDEK